MIPPELRKEYEETRDLVLSLVAVPAESELAKIRADEKQSQDLLSRWQAGLVLFRLKLQPLEKAICEHITQETHRAIGESMSNVFLETARNKLPEK